MTRVSYFLVNELPPVNDLIIGGIYYLNNGKQYIVKSDKSLLEIGAHGSDIVYDQSVRIDTLPNYFTAKKTVTSFRRASTGATGFLAHLENNYRLNNLEYDVNMIITVETEKLTNSGSEESIIQTITLKYYSDMGDPWGEQVLQSIGKLVRVKVSGANRFLDMGLFPVNLYLKDYPSGGLNGNYFGVAGATIYTASSDTKYVCVSELQSGFSSIWKKMTNPTVLNVTDAPIPPNGEEFVYDAMSVKDMIDSHSNRIATESELGHVRVDGSSINIDNDGVISSVSNSDYRIDNSLSLNTSLSNFKEGKTVSVLSRNTTLINIVNDTLGWSVESNNSNLSYILETDKIGTIGTQVISIYFKSSSLYQLMGKIRRGNSGTGNTWLSRWSADTILLNYELNSVIDPFGMKGVIRYIPSTNKFYTSTSTVQPSQYSWVELNPLASDIEFGTVKGDGVSISIDNGIASTVPKRYTILTEYIKTPVFTGEGVFIVPIATELFTDSNIEIYDDGKLLLPIHDYTSNYNESDENLTITWTPREHETSVIIKITKIEVV